MEVMKENQSKNVHKPFKLYTLYTKVDRKHCKE